MDPSPNSYFPATPRWFFVMKSVPSQCALSRTHQRNLGHTHRTRIVTVVRRYKVYFGASDLEARVPTPIEGGDTNVINEDAIAVGRSERTRNETIAHACRKSLPSRQSWTRVLESRFRPNVYMHPDTAFTIVGPWSVVFFLVIEHSPVWSDVTKPMTTASPTSNAKSAR
ncbi:MAG: hypothetical protein IPP40_16060 [bacterium]|nr:hypothetical protein [bacterium]